MSTQQEINTNFLKKATQDIDDILEKMREIIKEYGIESSESARRDVVQQIKPVERVTIGTRKESGAARIEEAALKVATAAKSFAESSPPKVDMSGGGIDEMYNLSGDEFSE